MLVAGRLNLLRCVLSVLALYAFAATTSLAVKVVRSLPHRISLGQQGRKAEARSALRVQGVCGARRKWPVYRFRNGVAGLHELRINGVAVVSESWESAASMAEILAYYSDQMKARGWSDVTEEAYGLDPRGRFLAGGEATLQHTDFAHTFVRVVENSAVFDRNSWRVHVLTEPVRGSRSTIVRVFATGRIVGTGFYREIASALWDRAGHVTASGVSIGEELGESSYRSRLFARPARPADSLKTETERLKEDGWEVQYATYGSGDGQLGSFALLSRGGEMAYLAAVQSPNSRNRSSLVFTQVSE